MNNKFFYLFFGFYLCLNISQVQAQSKSTSTMDSGLSVEASQIAMVKTPSEASQLVKGWSDKTRQGVQNMIAQETSVNKEIDVSYARLVKTCELAQAMKDSAPRFDSANAEVYEKQFLNRITKLENTRADLLSRYQNLIGGLNASQPKDCGGWGGGDSIPCIVYTYKKEMGAFMLTHVGTYYDILNKRYKTYLQIVGQAKQGCVRPDFLSKLSRSDEEHLISYEAKSTQIFNRLHNSISNAFINQSAP